MSNPICTIIAWYGSPLRRPIPYEFCDGAIIDIVTFPDLYGYLVAGNPALYISPTQAHLPDLRGEFLRGWDDRGTAPIRKIGDLQLDEIKSHAHLLGANAGTTGDGIFPQWKHMGSSKDSSGAYVPDKGWRAGISKTGDSETRPRNIAVSFLIKSAKNGEERPLADFLAELPDNFPSEIRKALTDIAEKVDSNRPPNRV